MPGADEFTDPLPYAVPWAWLAVGGLALVAGYYLAVWWWARPRPPAAGPRPDLGGLRERHLAVVDRIERDVSAGRLTPREAHQQLSATVRAFVGAASALPAHAMSLTDLRAAAPPRLAEAIGVMYPPEFAPAEEGAPRERLAEALGSAREVVATWT